jgi:hypothetical protein
MISYKFVLEHSKKSVKVVICLKKTERETKYDDSMQT